jgi:hypothetical protein
VPTSNQLTRPKKFLELIAGTDSRNPVAEVAQSPVKSTFSDEVLDQS